MTTEKTWTERFPHPGAEPPHPGPEPLKSDRYGFTTEHLAWQDIAQVRILWVEALRRHTVAKALDHLHEAEATAHLSSADYIAYVLGREFLVGGRSRDLLVSDMFEAP